MSLVQKIDRDQNINSEKIKPIQNSNGMIYRLQYLRALAAVSVVLCHASYYVGQYRDDFRMWAIFDRAGGFGVVLFFSISGYLMAQLAQSASSLRFMTHRLIRIYPIYWLCVVSVVAASTLFGVASGFDPVSLLLVPGATTSYVLGVEWTLPFELTFYIIIYVVILLRIRQYIPIISALWILLISLVFIVRPDLQQGQFPLLMQIPLSLYSVAFALGLLVPFAIRNRLIGPAAPLIGVSLIAISEAMPGIAPPFMILCLGCALLVAAAVRPSAEIAGGINQPLVALGDWSYALYLCHVPVIMLACKLLPKTVPSIQLWFATVGLPVIAAVIVGRIDLSIYRILKKWCDNSGKMLQVAVCSVFFIALTAEAGHTYFRIFLTRHISENSAALAAKIVERLGGSSGSLVSAVESIGLRPDPNLRGYVDGANYRALGTVGLQGWAADSTGMGRPIQVLIFHCGHYLGMALPQYSRPDVAKALRIVEDRHGFSETLSIQDGCDSSLLEALIVTKTQGYAITSTKIQR